MSRYAVLLHRLTAALLLTWWVGSAAAAPLVACCTGAQDCCVSAATGHGCLGCDAPAVAAAAPQVVLTPVVQALAVQAVPSPTTVSAPPWKPPD